MNISDARTPISPVWVVAIGALIATIAGLFLYAGGWFTPQRLSPGSMVNTFEHLNGVHPGFRRNHAKGVCVTGFFESNGNGEAISKASVFRPGRVPVVDDLPSRAESPWFRTLRRWCAAWRFSSHSQTAKNGEPA